MNHKLPDSKQTYWQLASIQLSGFTSLPVIATSILLLNLYNFTSALLTLILGNIILWAIRYVIIRMTKGERKSTLDLAKDYVGPTGGVLIAILLLLSTTAWFVTQTTLASNSLMFLIPLYEGPEISEYIQIAVFLGIASTLLCMEGIVVLRWLSVLSFPVVFIALLGVLITSPTATFPLSFDGISLAGLPLVIGTNLGVSADIPTFFRHARSHKDSLIALFIIQVATLFLSVMGLYLGNIIEPWFGIKENNASLYRSDMLRFFLILHITLSTICANVANVYSASVGWEIIAPKLAGRKEYLILGLGLTILFILITNIFSLNFLLETTDGGLINLALLLLIGYGLKRVLKREIQKIEKRLFFISWLFATLLLTLHYFGIFFPHHNPLVIGGVCLLVGLVLTIGARINILYYMSKKETLL